MRTSLLPSSSDLVTSDVDTKSTLTAHQTVLLHEAIAQLDIQHSDTVVDATLGGSGHAAMMVSHQDKNGTFIGFDLDPDAIARTHLTLHNVKPQTFLMERNFRDMYEAVMGEGIEQVDKVLFDLGWSGYQLSVGRGFSFLKDEPLIMTYTKDIDESTLTASTIVNEWERQSIADVIQGWGEERYAWRIAGMIVERRQSKPFTTSRELADAIKAYVPMVYRYGHIHPATKTFQALRIAVNDEFGALKDGMSGAWKLLRPGGRMAIITFHSLEDRIVKQQLVSWENDSVGMRITKKPITPSREELTQNPRARSAKLRVIEKI